MIRTLVKDACTGVPRFESHLWLLASVSHWRPWERVAVATALEAQPSMWETWVKPWLPAPTPAIAGIWDSEPADPSSVWLAVFISLSLESHQSMVKK